MAMAVTLAAQSRTGGSAFGFVRMWGTLGFLTSVIVFPRLLPRLTALGPSGWHDLEWHGLAWHGVSWEGLAWMFPTTAVCSLLAFAAALWLPRSPSMVLRSRAGDVGRLLRHPPIWRLLAFLFFAHLCLQGPINLFPLLVDSRGGDVATIGDMWILMLLLEIPLIGFSGPTLRRLGARGLLSIGLVAEGIRWTTCGFTTDLELTRAMQLLHGLGVAGVIVGGPLYLEQAVPERSRSTGQTLVSTVGFGLGAILSISGAGWLFEHVGPSFPYRLAGVGALVLAATVFRVLPAPWRPADAAADETPAAGP
jgi:hypothetical protein